jgi:hypothetical protein
VLLRHLGIPSGLCLELRCSIGLQIPLQEQHQAIQGSREALQLDRCGSEGGPQEEEGNVFELGEAGEGILKLVGVAGVLVLPWQVGAARILPVVVLPQLDVMHHHDVEVLETTNFHHEDPLDQLVNPLVEDFLMQAGWQGPLHLVLQAITSGCHRASCPSLLHLSMRPIGLGC